MVLGDRYEVFSIVLCSYLKNIKKWNSDAGWAACTMDLDVTSHVNTMSLFAQWVDSAISKTINLPNNYPYDDFKNVYKKAWEKGIKGFTTYRAGTMTNVLSKTSSANKIPKTVKELDLLSKDAFLQSAQRSQKIGKIAIAYTVWSTKKGGGKLIVKEVFKMIKKSNHLNRLVTLSPLTEMARNFHLRNGAIEVQVNEETQNFEYKL